MNKNLRTRVSFWLNDIIVAAYGHESQSLQPRNLHNRVMTSPRHSQRFFSCSKVVPSANVNLEGVGRLVEGLMTGSAQVSKLDGFIE
jgi:hypothetical protein